jgi:hypothetical protein
LCGVTTLPGRPEGGRQSAVFFLVVALEHASAISPCRRQKGL